MEKPSDITGNLRHDHWHVFVFDSRGRRVCLEHTRWGYGTSLTCGADPFVSPPPRPSPMPDYPPK